MGIFFTTVFTPKADEVIIGFALGFPPYQYQDATQSPVGIDMEVAKVVFQEMGLRSRIVQGPWDDIVAKLRLGQGVDVAGGMEITGERQELFDFSLPLYHRKNVIFVLEDTLEISSLGDLKGKLITGDRNSYIETLLHQRGDRKDIRIIQTESKEEAFQLLVHHRVEACLMPYAVGKTLAQGQRVKVRVIDVGDRGTPVAFAVKKGNKHLLNRLNIAIEQVQRKGLLTPYLGQADPGF